jgi:hypothetical protein
MPLEDVELLAIRQFQVEEIARAYLVPPFMIGHNEKTTSWGSGVEAMGVGFVRYTLRNYLNRIETEFNRKVYRGGNKFLAFDTTELERADTKSLFEAFRIALGRAGERPFMNQDEVRRYLKLKKKPGGDTMEPLMAGAAPAEPATPAEPVDPQARADLAAARLELAALAARIEGQGDTAAAVAAAVAAERARPRIKVPVRDEKTGMIIAIEEISE